MLTFFSSRKLSHPKGVPKGVAQMRRSERGVDDKAEIQRFLNQQTFGCLGLSKEKSPYVVPISYGYKWGTGDKNPTFYFHGAKEGRKISILEENANACFTVASSGRVINKDAGVPCSASIEFESVIAEGRIEFVGGGEAEEGLDAIAGHYGVGGKYGKKALSSTAVYKLVVDNMRCKKLAA